MYSHDKQKDIILFTGQPGINTRGVLEKLKNHGRISASILKIEEEMVELSGKNFREEILSDPPLTQEELWSEAFDSTKKEISKPEEGHYFFLNFHAVFYHQGKTEFLSPVDFKRFAELGERVKMLIVLIDDCYDIYKRLMGKGEMYDYINELDPLESLLKSIMNLFVVLSWREIEIAFSRKIASFLNVPLPYVIGVKHPYFIVSRLIREPFEKLKIMYLSHPISDIRKIKYPRSSSFYSELNEFVKDLLRQDNIVLFIPDVIDEKRIKKDETGEYYPELLNGWQLPYPPDDWLFVSHRTYLQGINPLNPRDFDFYNAGKELKSMISFALKFLDEKITEQINSRDRTLVEQSQNGIVIYRPYWNGIVPSLGVKEELKYNVLLREKRKEEKRRAFLIATEGDFGKLRINSLFEEIEENITNIDEKAKIRLEDLKQTWLDNSQKVLEFYNETLNRESIRGSLEEILPKEYTFKERYISVKETALSKAEMRRKYDIRDEGWKKIWSEILSPLPFKEFLDAMKDKYLLIPQTRPQEELVSKLLNGW